MGAGQGVDGGGRRVGPDGLALPPYAKGGGGKATPMIEELSSGLAEGETAPVAERDGAPSFALRADKPATGASEPRRKPALSSGGVTSAGAANATPTPPRTGAPMAVAVGGPPSEAIEARLRLPADIDPAVAARRLRVTLGGVDALEVSLEGGRLLGALRLPLPVDVGKATARIDCAASEEDGTEGAAGSAQADGYDIIVHAPCLGGEGCRAALRAAAPAASLAELGLGLDEVGGGVGGLLDL